MLRNNFRDTSLDLWCCDRINLKFVKILQLELYDRLMVRITLNDRLMVRITLNDRLVVKLTLIND